MALWTTDYMQKENRLYAILSSSYGSKPIFYFAMVE
jgi:hypothetical protein